MAADGLFLLKNPVDFFSPSRTGIYTVRYCNVKELLTQKEKLLTTWLCRKYTFIIVV